MDFGLYEMKIVRNNPSSVKSDPRLTRTNDLSPLGSDLSEVYCITISCFYLFLTPSSRSGFCAGVSLNIHSFIHSFMKVTPTWNKEDIS